MVWNSQHVDLSSVDTSDSFFRITTRTDAADLLPSVNELGIMNSPLLISRTNGEFRIVTGFRRITAAGTLGWSSIDANVLAPDTPMVKQVEYAISDNVYQRSLNLIEQARSLQLLSPHFPSIDRLSHAAACLQLPGNPKMISNLLALSRLPEAVHQSVLDNTLSLPVALMLRNLSSEDIHQLVLMFNILQLNLNIQREIMTLITEIAGIENHTIADVIKDENIQTVLYGSDMEKPLKTKEIRGYLKKKRFPEITSTEERFKKNVNALKLDSQTRLIPPKFFEGMTYSITLSFNSMEELEKRREMLDHITRSPITADILKRI